MTRLGFSPVHSEAHVPGRHLNGLLTAASLVEVIQRQSPGTWLPLEILRDGETLELVARFPQSFE